MSRNIFITLLVFFLIPTAGSAQVKVWPSPPDGKTLIAKQTAVNAGYRDETGFGTMLLMDAQGKTAAVRQFEFKRLEGTQTQRAKSLLTVLKPADLAGMRLLSVANPGKASDQWLYLPASHQVKRIVSSAKSGRFLGSEFSYEDLEPADPGAYDYRYLRKEKCDDSFCFVVQTIPHSKDSAYSKTVLWIRQDNFQNARIDFYGRKGNLAKQALFSGYRPLNGRFLRPEDVLMKNLQTGRQTRLTLQKIILKSGLSASEFSRAALER